ncbi:hypothetical protein OWR28_05735 [Chryseobacterium sp. 1B4]
MEQLVIIGLLIIIILILSERKFSAKVPHKDDSAVRMNIPSIMGETKQKERQVIPIDDHERQSESDAFIVDTFDSETNEEEFEPIGQCKNLNDILVKNDEEEEEEDWIDENSSMESGFATGVTFQELSTAGQLLQQDMLDANLEQQAVEIIQKIQGTELFDLLENSLGDASKRIATLLTASIPDGERINSSKRSNSSDSFDIGEFV